MRMDKKRCWYRLSSPYCVCFFFSVLCLHRGFFNYCILYCFIDLIKNVLLLPMNLQTIIHTDYLKIKCLIQVITVLYLVFHRNTFSIKYRLDSTRFSTSFAHLDFWSVFLIPFFLADPKISLVKLERKHLWTAFSGPPIDVP